MEDVGMVDDTMLICIFSVIPNIFIGGTNTEEVVLCSQSVIKSMDPPTVIVETLLGTSVRIVSKRTGFLFLLVACATPVWLVFKTDLAGSSLMVEDFRRQSLLKGLVLVLGLLMELLVMEHDTIILCILDVLCP